MSRYKAALNLCFHSVPLFHSPLSAPFVLLRGLVVLTEEVFLYKRYDYRYDKQHDTHCRSKTHLFQRERRVDSLDNECGSAHHALCCDIWYLEY